MRIFIHDHKASLEQAVRPALDILIKGGHLFCGRWRRDKRRALILIEAAHVPEAIATSQGGPWRAPSI